MSYKIATDGTPKGTTIVDTETGLPVKNVTEVTIRIRPEGVTGSIVCQAYVGEVKALFDLISMASKDVGSKCDRFLGGH